MTFLLVLLTLSVAVIVELIRRMRKDRIRVGSDLVTEYPSSFDVFDRYFHPGHTWVEISDQRTMKVGIDDFSARIIGSVDKIELPAVGQEVRQGDRLTVLHHGSRELIHVAPISGRIVEINRRLGKKPGIINASPLEQGWLAKISPSNLELELRNLLKGFAADGWRDAVRSELIQVFSPNFGTVVQDGGQIVESLSDHLTDEQWLQLVRQFFPGISSNQIKNNSKH